MDAIEYLKRRRLLCNENLHECKICPLYYNFKSCAEIEADRPEVAVAIVDGSTKSFEGRRYIDALIAQPGYFYTGEDPNGNDICNVLRNELILLDYCCVKKMFRANDFKCPGRSDEACKKCWYAEMNDPLTKFLGWPSCKSSSDKLFVNKGM